jgi:hypothetical protein
MTRRNLKDPTQYTKKAIVFDIDTAPGHGLLEYQYPKQGHVFKGGRSAVTTWQRIVSMTRKSVKEDTATADTVAGAGVPSKSAAGTMVDDDEVTDKTADDTDVDEAKPSKKRKINQTKKRKKVQGGQYPLNKCGRCNGGMRFYVPNGRAQAATVKSSTPCTCPMQEARMPSTETIYDDPEEIVGELIAYITKHYADFVIDHRTTAGDGTRTNSSKKIHSLFTRKHRLFEITMLIPVKGTFKFHSLLEKPPTIHTDDDDPNLCKICGLPPADNFHYQIECPCCTPKPSVCSSCFSKLSYRDRFSKPLQFKESSTSPELFKASYFAFVNQDSITCYYCRSEVQKFRLMSGNNTSDALLDIPRPYGWIGEFPCMSEDDFTQARKAFVHALEPYTILYNKLIWPLLRVSKMVEDKEPRIPGSCTMTIKSLLKLLEDVILHCENKMFHKVSWVKNSSCMKFVPEVDENSDPVDPLDDFDTKQRKQIEYVLENMQNWGLETMPMN